MARGRIPRRPSEGAEPAGAAAAGRRSATKARPRSAVRRGRPRRSGRRPAPDAEAGAPRRPPAAAPESRGKYVYCIIRSGRRRCSSGPSASAPSRPTCTPCTTRSWPPSSPTRRIEVFDATRENVLAHERVNETVMRSHTVIPMSFGTVFKTRDDIVELLRGGLRGLQATC